MVVNVPPNKVVTKTRPNFHSIGIGHQKRLHSAVFFIVYHLQVYQILSMGELYYNIIMSFVCNLYFLLTLCLFHLEGSRGLCNDRGINANQLQSGVQNHH